ncbi:Rad52/Rad22 family DNA repair protein (plasmid) [Nocardia sp. CA-151230]|uniref:Rad52/Rad22 family DNA repair protein n=1 Tax=Nocardia sp. CA-151230 TaxID=3239982 RepID=UPI003D8BE399
MSFTAAQVAQMLKPIAAARVLRDPKGHAHVSQQDVLAHLIRVFGFGNFDIDVLNAETVFEESYQKQKKDKDGQPYGDPFQAWDVCYRAMVRLTVRDPHGNEMCHYENGSTATAQGQPSRGDAHDLAYKSSISLSIKRAAIALGDNWGLSLYNRGQLTALVKGTLVHPEADTESAPEDMQDGVEKQVSLGNDEIDREGDDA